MWLLKLCYPCKSNLLAFQNDWLTAHLNKINSLPKPNMSMKNITFMKQRDVRQVTTTMTQEQKLLANFNCCLIMADNLTSYISQ